MRKREFYRVLPQYDGKRIKVTQYKHTHYMELIANELLTPYIVKKYNIPKHILSHEYVQEYYWFFGARFSVAQTLSEVQESEV